MHCNKAELRPVIAGLFFLGLTACGSTAKLDKQSPNAAVPLTVEGQAAIKQNDLSRARQQAIDNAVAAAANQAQPNGETPLQVSDIKIVDEWQSADAYHVQILAVPSSKTACSTRYRKRIVATAFPAVATDQITMTDSQDLYGGIPREIGNRLMESGDFILHNLTGTVLYAHPDLAPEIQPTQYFLGSSIVSIANQHGAQLVLSGVIRDFKLESTEYVRGSGLLAEVKSMLRDVVARRGIGIDVYVHDGFTGTLLFQHRYTDSALGDVSLPNGYSVGSERFQGTPVGHKITEIIAQASRDIQQLFSCHPLIARVVNVENNRIVIGAGAQDRIKRGDALLVYRAGSGSDVDRFGFQQINAQSIGVLRIVEVNAAYAVGVLDDSTGVAGVKPGDWVKSAGSL